MKQPRQQLSKGFTLLEILLVLPMVALLLLAVVQLMSQSADLWRNNARDIKAIENDKIALAFIRKLLDNAVPVNWKVQQNGQSKRIFIGKSDALYLVAPLPIAASQYRPGLYLFSLMVEQGKIYQNPALHINYWPLVEKNLDETLKGKKSTEVIMTDVKHVDFSYYGDKNQPGSQSAPSWHNDWQDNKRFPLAVKMSIARTTPEHYLATDNYQRFAWQDVVMTIRHRHSR